MSKFDFEKNLSKYKEKSINKLAKKYAKNCLVTRSKDMEALCNLAYWLYIYDYKDEILNIYNLVDIDILKKVNFNIWTWILLIWAYRHLFMK